MHESRTLSLKENTKTRNDRFIRAIYACVIIRKEGFSLSLEREHLYKIICRLSVRQICSIIFTTEMVISMIEKQECQTITN